MSGIHMIVIDLLLFSPLEIPPVIIFDKTDIVYTASCSTYSTITTPSTKTKSHESLGITSTISVNSSPTVRAISKPRIINKVAIPTSTIQITNVQTTSIGTT